VMNGWHGGMTWEGWFFVTALLGAAARRILWAAAQLFSGRRDARTDTAVEPQQILDRRLATGEIDVETYEKLRRTLGAARGVS
jgi:putative membrane protein